MSTDLGADVVGDDAQRGLRIHRRAVGRVLQPGQLTQREQIVVHEPLRGVQRGQHALHGRRRLGIVVRPTEGDELRVQ